MDEILVARFLTTGVSAWAKAHGKFEFEPCVLF